MSGFEHPDCLPSRLLVEKRRGEGVVPRSRGAMEGSQDARTRSCTDRIRLRNRERTNQRWQFRRSVSYAILDSFASIFGLRAGPEPAVNEAIQPMCGIAGIFRYRSDRPIETTILGE